jgi:hypothetical protein
MTVYIVLRNGAVDQVFDSREAAELHRANLVRLWALTEILERTVNMI